MSSDTAGSAPEQAASDLLHRWYEAWNAHDVSAISALMTEDVQYEDPGATEPSMRGRSSVEAWARTAFRAVPDMHLELLEEWVSQGGRVIASYFRFTATSTGPLDPPGLAPTNARYETYGMDRSEVRDGLVARHQIFWDIAERGREMGVLPPRGSLAEGIAIRLQHLTAWRMRHRSRRHRPDNVTR